MATEPASPADSLPAWDHLPPDALRLCYAFLPDAASRAACRLVCTHWQHIADESSEIWGAAAVRRPSTPAPAAAGGSAAPPAQPEPEQLAALLHRQRKYLRGLHLEQGCTAGSGQQPGAPAEAGRSAGGGQPGDAEHAAAADALALALASATAEGSGLAELTLTVSARLHDSIVEALPGAAAQLTSLAIKPQGQGAGLRWAQLGAGGLRQLSSLSLTADFRGAGAADALAGLTALTRLRLHGGPSTMLPLPPEVGHALLAVHPRLLRLELRRVAVLQAEAPAPPPGGDDDGDWALEDDPEMPQLMDEPSFQSEGSEAGDPAGGGDPAGVDLVGCFSDSDSDEESIGAPRVQIRGWGMPAVLGDGGDGPAVRYNWIHWGGGRGGRGGGGGPQADGQSNSGSDGSSSGDEAPALASSEGASSGGEAGSRGESGSGDGELSAIALSGEEGSGGGGPPAWPLGPGADGDEAVGGDEGGNGGGDEVGDGGAHPGPVFWLGGGGDGIPGMVADDGEPVDPFPPDEGPAELEDGSLAAQLAARWQQLQALRLEGCHFTALEALQHLPHLTSLVLTSPNHGVSVGFQGLQRVLHCRGLQELAVGEFGAERLPSLQAGQLQQLTRLRLRNVVAKELPPSWCALPCLLSLELEGIGGMHLPDELSELTQLQRLKLNCRNGHPAPLAPVTGLSELTSLTVTACHLRNLPEGPYLRNLRELVLRDNMLPCVPPALDHPEWGASGLRHLDLSDNSEIVLSEGDVEVLSRLTSLTSLDLRCQQYKKYDKHPEGALAALRAALPRCEVVSRARRARALRGAN